MTQWDVQLGQVMPVQKFQYVVLLQLMARIMRVRWMTGIDTVNYDATLVEAMRHTLVPTPVARYIESVGTVTLAAGHTVIPEAINAGFFKRTIAELFTMIGEVVTDHPYGYCASWLTAYCDRISRFSQTGMKFVAPQMDITAGREEFLVSYVEDVILQTLTPHSPQQMSQSTAEMGALYRYRKVGEPWQDNSVLSPTHVGHPFMEPIMASRLLDVTNEDAFAKVY